MDGKFKPFLLPSKTPACERFAWVHAELRDAAGENLGGEHKAYPAPGLGDQGTRSSL